ncbi:hypothetical protein H6F74_27950 [Trichocoleus sp. FACHB-90]|uniref:hypothetical protein n=1 Tax=Cyanophyceae TaxID=3028117 RepID=UPI001681CB1C|nr:hypothetical protein [Trichocoleus sp. FACHB-90]MBD1930031.1 hypothetical protein [Trichocoleus sp. FACHB-90]
MCKLLDARRFSRGSGCSIRDVPRLPAADEAGNLGIDSQLEEGAALGDDGNGLNAIA